MGNIENKADKISESFHRECAGNSRTAADIWRNGRIPVIYHRGRGSTLLVRVPYREGNREYLKGSARSIHWIEEFRAWEVARSRFDYVVARALARWGAAYIIQAFRPMKKCAPACWDAIGHDCECSCMGKNHGSRLALQHVVSETFAFEWGPKRLACRLIRADLK